MTHSSTGTTFRKSFKLLINDESDDDESNPDLNGNDYTDHFQWPEKIDLPNTNCAMKEEFEEERSYHTPLNHGFFQKATCTPSYLSLMVNNTTSYQDNSLFPAIPDTKIPEQPIGTPAKKTMPSCNGYHLYQKEFGAVIANIQSPNTEQRYDKISTLSRLTSHRWKQLPPEQKQEYSKRAQHLRESIGNGFLKADIFYCSKCQTKSFKREKDLKYHEKECGLHKCEECGKEFSDGVLYHKHCKIHTNKYKCEICDKRFSAANSLKRHLEHHQNIVYNCEKCSQKFTARTNLSRHMKNIHKSL